VTTEEDDAMSRMRTCKATYVRSVILAQHVIEVWNEYETTGLFVGAADADAWLAALEEGRAIAPGSLAGDVNARLTLATAASTK
jgi:hypothetical protein